MTGIHHPGFGRLATGRPLAVGVLGALIVILVVWTRAPAEPTPGPPTLPVPPQFQPTPVPPANLVAEPSAPGPVAEEEPAPAAPDDTAQQQEVLATCERIANRLGSVDLEDCTEPPLALSGARSAQGTPILVAEYPPLAGREPLGRVLLFGGIHGDELSSVSIVFGWLDTLDNFHSGLFHWRIAPLVNPDGLLRRPSQRQNDNGVDLNRNFPSPNWLVEAPDYWVRRTSKNPRRYPGEAPLSEPESRWLHEQIETFEPAAIVAVHAPLHVLDYDGPPDPPERLGPLVLKQMGTYPGSLGRFAGVHLGLPVVTLELPSAGIMPSLADQNQMWVDLVRWLRRNVPKQDAVQVARTVRANSAPAAGANR